MQEKNRNIMTFSFGKVAKLTFLGKTLNKAKLVQEEISSIFNLGQCFSTAGPRPGTGRWHQ